MGASARPERDIVAEELARIRGEQSGDVEAELARIRGTEFMRDLNAASERSKRKTAREEASAAERRLTGGERVGAAVQNALGVASFGVGNLAGDALDALASDRTFEANRQARRMTTDAMPAVDRMASSLAGAMLNPVGPIVRAPSGAGLLARGAAFAGDVGLQGGATSALSALEGTSPEDIRQAWEAGKRGAMSALPAAAGLRAGVSLARGGNALIQVARAKPLDIQRHALQDAMRAVDDVNFGRVRGEATGPATREVVDVLNSPTVAPFAQMVRNSEEFAGANENVILLESYKRMSEAQRKAERAQEGSPELLASITQKNRDIGLAKGRMLTAADPSMPSLRPANVAHAEMRGRIEAFGNTADAIQRILNKRSQKGEDKILLESPEALRRAIGKMTPAEARDAYQAILGRTKEVAKTSTNMITGFGIPGAVVRTTMAPHQINPYLRLLEKQAGIRPGFFENPVTAERSGLLGARTAGSEESRRSGRPSGLLLSREP